MTTISTGSFSASSSARRDFPLAVGPSSTAAALRKLATAGDVDDRAGGVGGLVGSEPEDGAGDFLGLARACERRHGADALEAARVAAAGVDLGANHAGAHGVDADAVAGNFLRQAHGEGIDRP